MFGCLSVWFFAFLAFICVRFTWASLCISGLKAGATIWRGEIWIYESYNTAQEFTDGSDMLDLPIVNGKGDVQVKVPLPDGIQLRYVSRSLLI